MALRARPLIRAATAEDLEALLALENRCFRAHRFDRADFRYHLQNGASILFLAEITGQAVGYIGGIIYHGARNRIGKLYSMAVMPEWRHNRIGVSMLRDFEKEAARRGASSVSLEVRKSNRSARALYFRAGYRIDSVLKDHYGRGSDGLRMRKNLLR